MTPEELINFKKAIKTINVPTRANSYQKYGDYSSNRVSTSFSLEAINDIIHSGNIRDMRALSEYYARTNGIYRNSVMMMANLPRYDTVLTPIFDVDKTEKKSLLKNFNNASKTIDALNIPLNFSRVSYRAILMGVYYGILREKEGKFTIQDLPEQYCRSRFKDFNGLPVLEFNLDFFDTITDKKERDEIAASYPREIAKAYLEIEKKKKKKKAQIDHWISIEARDGGMCFTYGDHTPIFISAIPELYKLEEATEREAKRDQNELYKLLIQKMPIDSKGQLVFQMEEVADIHESVANMFKNSDTIDVLTTFGDTSLESLQDQTAASQSANRLEKYTTNAYNNLGISELYFNANNSSSMPYTIAKDEAFMHFLTEQYSAWIRVFINKRYGKRDLSYDFSILPTTIFNFKDVQKQYFQGAQYGYSKIYAGVALGIKQTNLINLISFENDYLNLSERMKPLQSSYTSSGKKENSSDEPSTNVQESEGRPPLNIEERSEKTQKNIEAT